MGATQLVKEMLVQLRVPNGNERKECEETRINPATSPIGIGPEEKLHGEHTCNMNLKTFFFSHLELTPKNLTKDDHQMIKGLFYNILAKSFLS